MDLTERAHIFLASAEKGKGNIQSLLDLCIKKIVQDHATTRNTLKLVPCDLFQSFLVSALIHERQLCVKEIIAQWPYRVLNLKTLMPKLDDVKCKVCTGRREFSTRSYIEGLCIMIAVGFQQQIQHNGKLQVLDMTGLDFVVHGSRMSGEKQGATLGVLQSLEKNLHLKRIRASNHSPTIYMDWTIHSDDNYRVFIHCLNSVSSFMSVKCREVRCSNMSVNKIGQMLSMVDPEVLDALYLRQCGLSQKGLCRILPIIKRLTNLTSLDLSYNVLSHHSSQQNFYKKLANALETLSNLTRFQVSGNRLGGKLRSLLQHIRKPLVALNVSSCQLDAADISYLANSHHATQLEELELGYNNLAKDPESLFKLLTSSSGTLRHLDLEKASLRRIPSVTNQLVQLSYSLKQLLTLTITGNNLKVRDQAEIVASYALNVPTLLILHVTLYCVSTGQSDCVKVCARLPEWDRVNVDDGDLNTFLDTCVRFRQSEPKGDLQELHVLTTKDDGGFPRCTSIPSICCFLFQF